MQAPRRATSRARSRTSGSRSRLELPRRPRRRLLAPVPLALIGVLLIACGFIAGVLVEKGQSTSGASVAAACDRSPRASRRSAPAGLGRRRTRPRDRGGRCGWPVGGGAIRRSRRGSAGATVGQVAYLSGSTLYVTTREGNTVKVTTSAATSVTKTVKAERQGIHPGETVTVTGCTAANGASPPNRSASARAAASEPCSAAPAQLRANRKAAEQVAANRRCSAEGAAKVAAEAGVRSNARPSIKELMPQINRCKRNPRAGEPAACRCRRSPRMLRAGRLRRILEGLARSANAAATRPRRAVEPARQGRSPAVSRRCANACRRAGSRSRNAHPAHGVRRARAASWVEGPDRNCPRASRGRSTGCPQEVRRRPLRAGLVSTAPPTSRPSPSSPRACVNTASTCRSPTRPVTVPCSAPTD